LLWGLFWLISRIPGVSSLVESPPSRRVSILALTVVFFLGLAATYLRFAPPLAAPAPQPAAAAQPAGGAPAAAPAVQPLDRAGALGGCLVAAWLLATAVVTLSRHKSLAESNIALREGVLWPLFITAL